MSDREHGAVSSRFRTPPAHSLKEQTGRLEALWTTGCTILTPQPPVSDTLYELWIHLRDDEWPLRMDRARITPKCITEV